MKVFEGWKIGEKFGRWNPHLLFIQLSGNKVNKVDIACWFLISTKVKKKKIKIRFIKSKSNDEYFRLKKLAAKIEKFNGFYTLFFNFSP